MDLHYCGKLDSDPHYSEKLNPHSETLEAQNGAVEERAVYA
jgi:hypothetical protein